MLYSNARILVYTALFLEILWVSPHPPCFVILFVSQRHYRRSLAMKASGGFKIFTSCVTGHCVLLLFETEIKIFEYFSQNWVSEVCLRGLYRCCGDVYNPVIVVSFGAHCRFASNEDDGNQQNSAATVKVFTYLV